MALNYASPVSVSEAQRKEFLDFALTIAMAAGRATLPYFRVQTRVDNKLSGSGFDPVTEADRAAEQCG